MVFARELRQKSAGASRLPLAILLFTLLAFVVLALPDTLEAITARAFLRLPIELPLMALAMLVLPVRWARRVAILLALLLCLVLFLKLADIGTQAAFQRSFNPYLDGKMLADGWNLVSRSVGIVPAGLAVAALLLVFVLLLSAFFWSLRRIAGAAGPVRGRLVAAFAAITVIGMGLSLLQPGGMRLAGADAAGYLFARADLVSRSVVDMRAFEAELAKGDGVADGRGLFQAVQGRDVVLVFVESYGRSAVEDPRYAGTTGPRLASIQQRLEAVGMASASGWLRSPTVGGLSWLAHGTFLSGLWIDSQPRYDRLMTSDRPTLNRLFTEAGWRSVAVMPAITLAWPESAYFGYDQVFASADLGYRGKPYNWITMPDQYTLSAFERLARRPQRTAGGPVMAEIALISSHAPWTPVAAMVGWDQVGDGTIFNAQAESGDPPAVVWADPERVRRQYIATIDYSLEALGDYMARFGRDAVFIVLGDHQPAAIVTGQNASRDVPIHIVSADKGLIARFQATGFSAGMLPDPRAAERPMSDMRGLLIELLGGAPQ